MPDVHCHLVPVQIHRVDLDEFVAQSNQSKNVKPSLIFELERVQLLSSGTHPFCSLL